LADVEKHPEAYPLLMTAIQKLPSRYKSLLSKIRRANDLLRSLEGNFYDTQSNSPNDSEEGIFWKPVYGFDRELEKMFRDVGGRTSSIAFVEGYSNLIIDDEKLHLRSVKANDRSLSRHKSAKAFGPVGNCVNSIATGISLSCHMSHHGESSKDILTSSLMIIKGINNPNSVHFPGTIIHGDRGYNDDECFSLIEDADMGFLNTTKRGPTLAFKFGNTRYNTTQEQRDIPEHGPMLSLGATRAVGDATSYFVAYRNGTGRVTFLQSTIPSLSYACFDYVPVASDRAYSKTFSQILRKQTYDEDDYDPTTFLSERESFLREIFDRHCVYLACKDQGGDDWRFL